MPVPSCGPHSVSSRFVVAAFRVMAAAALRLATGIRVPVAVLRPTEHAVDAQHQRRVGGAGPGPDSDSDLLSHCYPAWLELPSIKSDNKDFKEDFKNKPWHSTIDSMNLSRNPTGNSRFTGDLINLSGIPTGDSIDLLLLVLLYQSPYLW